MREDADAFSRPALASASAMREKLRAREVSSVELSRAALARIDALDGAVNAVVARDDAAAMAAAALSDARIARGEARPLEGLPITLKDSWETAGLATTCGAPEFARYVPESDAVAVARLRAAGAVLIGKTNVPPMCGDFQSYNAIYGTSDNPWNATLTPGGSSGGAAAAVACGFCAFELGSDLGGSIRWPAAACGVFGLKPTWDLVPMFGHIPPTPGMRAKAPLELGVGGPLARSAADLDLVLAAVAGPLNAAGPAFLKKPRKTRAAELRLAVWLDESVAFDPRVVRATHMAADIFAREGAHVSYEARPAFAFPEVFEIYSLLHGAIGLSRLPREARDALAARAKDYAPGDMSHRALQARAARMSAELYGQIARRRREMRAALNNFLGDYDAILTAPAPAPAIKHDHSDDLLARRIAIEGGEIDYFDQFKGAALATLLNAPAVVAPVLRVPFETGQLPLGVQIICAEGEDRSAIALAAMLERATGGFSPPPGFG